MTIFHRIAACALIYLLTASACLAQSVLLPGSLKGPGTAGLGGARRLCTPLSVGLSEWKIEWIARLLGPSDAQISYLRQLSADSLRAKQAIAAGCDNRPFDTSIGELAAMEQRLRGLMEAITIVRPSFDAFYASLDERQKARLDSLGPARRGWRW